MVTRGAVGLFVVLGMAAIAACGTAPLLTQLVEARRLASAFLDGFDWMSSGLVDTLVGSDEIDQGRPRPDGIVAAMKRTGVGVAERVAKVGNTPADLVEGTLAGCGWVVGVTHATHRRNELFLAPHTHLVASLSEMLHVLGVPRPDETRSHAS